MTTTSKKKKTLQEITEPLTETLLDNETNTVYSVENNFFPIIKDKLTNTYSVIFGTNRISEWFDTFEEAVSDSKRNDINRIITIMQLMYNIKGN